MGLPTHQVITPHRIAKRHAATKTAMKGIGECPVEAPSDICTHMINRQIGPKQQYAVSSLKQALHQHEMCS